MKRCSACPTAAELSEATRERVDLRKVVSSAVMPAARRPMMAITIAISIRVKPFDLRRIPAPNSDLAPMIPIEAHGRPKSDKSHSPGAGYSGISLKDLHL